CIQTLRDARVNLVGCVMNKDTGASVKKCFSRWTSAWIVAALLGLSAQVGAQERAPVVGVTAQRTAREDARPTEMLLAEARPLTSVSNVTFSASSRRDRAEWQKRLTLGPGDVLNVALFGQHDADRKEVPIGPDGRIS